MDSRIYGVPLLAAPVAPSYNNPAASGIRAPLTVVDESDFEYSSRRNSITSSYGNGEFEGFLSGDDDFESASEIPRLSEKDEGSSEETHIFKDYVLSGPSVIKPNVVTRQRSSNGNTHAFYRKNPDEAFARESDSVSGNTLVRPVVRGSDERVIKVVRNVDDSDYSGDEIVEDERYDASNGASAPPVGVMDGEVSESETIPVVEPKIALVEKLQVPVAKISVDSDDDSENSVVSEDDDFSGIVRVPSTEILRRFDSTPKARLTEVGQGDDQHDLQADNASDLESGKEMVTSDHDLGSEDEAQHFGVDDLSIECVVSSDLIPDGKEHNSKFKQEQNGDDVHLDEEIREIDVISDLRKCADLIYQREHTDLGSISSTAELSCSYETGKLMESEVTELGYRNSSFGLASSEEEHSSMKIQEIDVISYQGDCVDLIDEREPTSLGSIPFADASEAPSCLSGIVNLMEPEVTKLGGCISKFEAAPMDDGDQKSSNTILASTDSSQISELSEAFAENVLVDVSDGDSLLKVANLTGLSNACQFVFQGKSDKEMNKATESSEQLSEVLEQNPAFLSGGEGLLDQQEVTDDQIETPSLNGEFEKALSEAEKKHLERIQQIRVRYLQLVHLVGYSSDDSLASKVLYLLTVAEERIYSQASHLDSTRKAAMELEASKNEHLDFSICILVIGKTGVGKSSTINSIFGEKKTAIDAFEPATTSVKEIIGTIDGVKLKVIDTPGLRTSSIDERINRKVLLSIKRVMQKSPPDVILYVDRLDSQTGDLNDLPVLKSVSSCLGLAMWQKSILVLTHATSMPPDGPDGYPLSCEVFVAQQSLLVQQLISHSAGEFLITGPGHMIPVSLVENHPFAEKNGHGERLPNHGGSWKSQLLLLCYSMKTLSDVNAVVTLQNPLDIRKVFGLPIHSPSRSYLLSSFSQPNAHPKLSNDQSGESVNSDTVLGYSSCSDQEDDIRCENLLIPEPLKNSHITKLSLHQRTACLEEYDYLVNLRQKKQQGGAKKGFKDSRKTGNGEGDDACLEGVTDEENRRQQTVRPPLRDMHFQPSFDGDGPFASRVLEPSQLLTELIFNSSQWKHGYCYDDNSVSPMAGLDVHSVKAEFSNFKRNETTAEVFIAFLNENEALEFQVKDHIPVCEGLTLSGNAGVIASQDDAACAASVELCRTHQDYPTSLGLSVMKHGGDLTCGCSLQSQFSVGRSSKLSIRAGLNNKLNGRISIKTSSSDQLQIAALALFPVAKAIFKKVIPLFAKDSLA